MSKGEIMPRLVIRNPRRIPWLDALLGMRAYSTDATWTLVSYNR